MILTLTVIGVVESAVYVWRYRAATRKCPWQAGLSTFATTAMKLVFVWVGAGAVIAGTPWWAAMLAYAVPATVATGVVPWWVESA